MATILAPTQKLPQGAPGREWRASRATPCEGMPWQFGAGTRIVAMATAWVHRRRFNWRTRQYGKKHRQKTSKIPDNPQNGRAPRDMVLCVSWFGQAVENYLGQFLEKLQKIWKKYKKMPAKGAREARPFVAAAIVFCTFSIFLQFFQKMAQVVFHTNNARCNQRVEKRLLGNGAEVAAVAERACLRLLINHAFPSCLFTLPRIKPKCPPQKKSIFDSSHFLSASFD